MTRNRHGGRAIALTVLALAGLAAAPAGRKGPSGLDVPRYVSLKFNEVNARGGPGEDYRLLGTYRTKGLPLQVIAETKDWRRVCDPTGEMTWVKGTAVDSRRTVMRTAPEPIPLRRRPDAAAAPAAMLNGRSIAALDDCKAGWCRVSAGGARGWAPASAFWGVDEAQQCRPPPPPRPKR